MSRFSNVTPMFCDKSELISVAMSGVIELGRKLALKFPDDASRFNWMLISALMFIVLKSIARGC